MILFLLINTEGLILFLKVSHQSYSCSLLSSRKMKSLFKSSAHSFVKSKESEEAKTTQRNSKFGKGLKISILLYPGISQISARKVVVEEVEV